MVEIMVNRLLGKFRKGFKLSCTAEDLTMQELLRALVAYGYTYYEYRNFIAELIESDDWMEKIDNRISDISNFTKSENFSTLWKSLSFYQFLLSYKFDSQTSTKIELENNLKRIAEINLYLLTIKKEITLNNFCEVEKK